MGFWYIYFYDKIVLDLSYESPVKLASVLSGYSLMVLGGTLLFSGTRFSECILNSTCEIQLFLQGFLVPFIQKRYLETRIWVILYPLNRVKHQNEHGYVGLWEEIF